MIEKKDWRSHICHEVFQNLPLFEQKITCLKRKNALIISGENIYLEKIIKK